MANEVAEQLLAVRNKTLAQSQPEVQPEAVPQTEEPKVEVEKVEPDPEPAAEPEKSVEAIVEKGWDDEEETEVKPSAEINISEWVSDLDLGEIKSKEEFKTKVSELKSKLKEYETAPLAGVPEDFKEVIEVAKTGDWKDYLASQLIDYSKLGPEDAVAEFESDFLNRAQGNPKYFTDGKFDVQKAEEALDAMPEAVRETYGHQILQAKATNQLRQREAIKAKAEAKRTEADKTLAQATSKLGEILPLESYGIKFEPKHSSEIYNGIVSSKLTKKHLGQTYEDLVRSGADMKAVVRTITLAEKGEKMIAHKSNKSATQTKKEMLNNLQNVQLNTSGTVVQPENPDKKADTPTEKLTKYYESLNKKWL